MRLGQLGQHARPLLHQLGEAGGGAGILRGQQREQHRADDGGADAAPIERENCTEAAAAPSCFGPATDLHA